MKFLMRLSLPLAFAGLLLAGRATADDANPVAPQQAPAKASNPLDEQLLKSLDNQLLDGLDDVSLRPAVKKAAPPAKSDTKPNTKQSGDIEQQPESKTANPLDQAGGGEDLGEASERDPLKQIERAMRAAGQQIGQTAKDASDGNPAGGGQSAAKLQQQALDQLGQLIEQIQQQKNQSQSQSTSNSSGQQKPSKPASGKAGDPSQSQTPADQIARDSSNKLQERKTGPVEPTSPPPLASDLWIRLPAKAREQIKQSQDQQFLPKYQRLVERYFRRLAEDDPDRQ